jgi:hypothetical protein
MYLRGGGGRQPMGLTGRRWEATDVPEGCEEVGGIALFRGRPSERLGRGAGASVRKETLPSWGVYGLEIQNLVDKIGHSRLHDREGLFLPVEFWQLLLLIVYRIMESWAVDTPVGY